MIIDKLCLRNVGPHVKLDVQLGSGLIGLVGPNGAGKSTLVNSIYAALTNDFSRFQGVRSDIITNTSKPKQASYIRLTGRHHEQRFQLTRHLRPNKNELILDGEEPLTKANDIAEAVSSKLGVSKQIIDRYVFVEQWEMFQFLSQTPSERAKTFQFLCGTTEATEIHKLCTEYVSKNAQQEVVDNSLELSESIEMSHQSMRRYRKQGEDAKAKLAPKSQRQAYRQVLKRNTQARTAKQNLEELNPQLTKLGTQLASLKKQIEQLDSDLQERRDELEALDLDAERLQDLQQLVRETDSHYQSRTEKLEKEQQKRKAAKVARAKALKMAQLEPPEGYLERGECRQAAVKEMGAITHQQEAEAELVELYQENAESGVCPYCQEPMDEEKMTKLVEAYQARSERYKELETILQASQDYDQKQSEANAQQEQSQTQLKQLNRSIQEMEAQLPCSPDSGEYREAYQQIQQYQQLAEKISSDESTQQVNRANLTNLQDRLKTEEQRKAKYREHRRQRPSKQEFLEARQQLRQHQQAVNDRKVARECFGEAKRSWEESKRTLLHLKAKLARQTKIQNLMEPIGTVGGLFHWNRLPKQVSQANMEMLVGDINQNLELFGNPFYVEADEDLTFRVFFPGQPAVKGKQLSGGQKVILAVAFRAALDSVFGHDVGMLFLDEPTAGLDADNMNYFHDALQILAQKVAEDRQLMVITHAQELGEVFDQLIEL